MSMRAALKALEALPPDHPVRRGPTEEEAKALGAAAVARLDEPARLERMRADRERLEAGKPK